MLSVNDVPSSVFTASDSVTLKPVVSAEWNQNLFNPPYITFAGSGSPMSISLTSGTVESVTDEAKPNFTTKKFSMSNNKGSITYTVTADNGRAYKIVTYVKTNSSSPVMLNSFAESGTVAFGSTQEDVSSLGWTKIVTYIGVAQNESNGLSSFTYTLNVNSFKDMLVNPDIYFTVPQVYKTSYEEYKYGQLWPTESVFTYFRPGESYVGSGNSNCSFPNNYRKITSTIINGYLSPVYSPVSSILQMPSFFFASPPVPIIKSSLPTDISPYKYFVSESSNGTITGIYEKAILTNKIVIKFNTTISSPTILIEINNSVITVDGSTSITLNSNSENIYTGVLTLYWTGSAWTKTPWTSMPQFNTDGTISKTTSITKITVQQLSNTLKSQVSSYTNNTNAINDFNRMQIIEVSPRLEIDLTDFVESVSIDKSLDSQTSLLPISSINANSCNINLSGIPLLYNNQAINIFSSQSDQSSTLLSNILRKNIKFYVHFNLLYYSDLSANTNKPVNAFIPGGVFYSDSWDESDINSVSIQAFDITRYLQSTPSPDYVANLKTVFDIITNILECAGFTDYDYDSLYRICNNKAVPMDIAYFYCNSKDSTIVDTLNKLFLSYQIGAYIDEYGIMKFLDLHNILSSNSSVLSLDDFNIAMGSFSISNKAKPGKISLRYQSPKVKQSPSLQNVSNPMIKNSPSFLYSTSNDVVWSQQSIDSVGFNYLYNDMNKDSNVMNINVNDLLDIFHTFSRDYNGYAFIDNEIVSFLYKEYTIQNTENTKSKTVSIKNDLELQSEINNFIKVNSIGLRTSFATITNATSNGTTVYYTANNSFRSGDKVIISGIDPTAYNLSGTITSATSSQFTLSISDVTGQYVSGGEATIPVDYDILVEPTGNITNVQRGLFGTLPKDHKKITSLSSKGLSIKTMSPSLTLSSASGLDSIITESETSLPAIKKLQLGTSGNNTTIVYPTSEVDKSYQTYSVKFNMPDQNIASAGLFFNMNSDSDSGNTYFVELIRFNQTDSKTDVLYNPPKYKYLLVIWNPEYNERFYADVSAECNNIVSNTVKIIKKTATGNNKFEYSTVSEPFFNLKVVHHLSNGEDGEQTNKRIISVFINSREVIGWNQEKEDDYDAETNPTGSGWKPTLINPKTGMRQRPSFTDNISSGRKFGFMTSLVPTQIGGVYPPYNYPSASTGIKPANLKEIHATQKPLKERSVNYFYQDREFLNGLVQGQPLYTNSLTYLMQTNPEISGINYYDIQYTTPAAVSVDVLPIEYMLYYFPGNDVQDQKNYQKKLVDEYSLAYSTPINTGFRAKLAVANNSPHLVFLSKEADTFEVATVVFNLWTHEIVAPSDPEILEVVIDPSNINEVAQLDSQWLQSKDSAQKMLKVISMGIEGFSKTVNLDIFGNPLIQVGDVLTLTYSIKGITNQKYLVKSISHTFSTGLTTRLSLGRIQ